MLCGVTITGQRLTMICGGRISASTSPGALLGQCRPRCRSRARSYWACWWASLLDFTQRREGTKGLAATVCRVRRLAGDLGFDDGGELVERLLPTEVAHFGWDRGGDAFLHDRNVCSAEHFFERDGD